ncbi:MAG: trigger factor, partial [Tissierellia bacterium]|nr:trigger factor [Tissierellia bacterium]
FDTLEEYKQSIREKLEKEAKEKEQVEIENKIVEKLVELSEMDVPEVMIENQIENEVDEFNYRLSMQGLNIEQYLQYTNSTLDDFKEQVRPVVEKKVKADLVLEAVAKVEKLEATDEDVDKELERLAKEYNLEDVEKFKEDMKKSDLEYLKAGIIRDKTIELLVSNTKFI